MMLFSTLYVLFLVYFDDIIVFIIYALFPVYLDDIIVFIIYILFSVYINGVIFCIMDIAYLIGSSLGGGRGAPGEPLMLVIDMNATLPFGIYLLRSGYINKHFLQPKEGCDFLPLPPTNHIVQTIPICK